MSWLLRQGKFADLLMLEVISLTKIQIEPSEKRTHTNESMML